MWGGLLGRAPWLDAQSLLWPANYPQQHNGQPAEAKHAAYSYCSSSGWLHDSSLCLSARTLDCVFRYGSRAQWAGLDVPHHNAAHWCDEGVFWGFGSIWCNGRILTSLQLLSGHPISIWGFMIWGFGTVLFQLQHTTRRHLAVNPYRGIGGNRVLNSNSFGTPPDAILPVLSTLWLRFTSPQFQERGFDLPLLHEAHQCHSFRPRFHSYSAGGDPALSIPPLLQVLHGHHVPDIPGPGI